MKRLLIATALTLAAASSAMATTYASGTSFNTTLPATMQFDIRALVPSADLSNLTISQVGQFYNLFSTSDNLGSGDNPAGAVRAILAQNN